MVFGIFGKQLFLESGLSRGDYPNYIFFECVNYPLSICSDGRQQVHTEQFLTKHRS